MAARKHDLEPVAGGSAALVERAPMRQRGMSRDERAARLVVGLLYAPMPWFLRLLVTIHFRRLRLRGARRFPSRGPALVVANHPSTWADVLVLEAVLGRKLHFLANETLFHPAPRAWLLRLFGSLPVAQSRDEADHERRNADTFRRCDELLGRGEVIAVFPEGVSAEDRSLRPFFTGAARIALARRVRGGRLTVVPVGIHYADRIAFRTDVVVSVGDPFDLSHEAVPTPEARLTWIEAVTLRLHEAVAKLIVDVPSPRARRAVEELAPLMPAGRDGDPGLFRRSRGVARNIERLRADPEGLATLERAVTVHRLRRERLGIDLRTLDSGSGAPVAVLAVFAALAGLPALIGILLNALPALATMRYLRRFTDPTRVALARIGTGLGIFVPWYVALATIPAFCGWPWWSGVAFVIVSVGLGSLALVWSDAIRVLRTRIALARIAREERRPAEAMPS